MLWVEIIEETGNIKLRMKYGMVATSSNCLITWTISENSNSINAMMCAPLSRMALNSGEWRVTLIIGVFHPPMAE